jgi:type IV pilus assembly protein PilM
VEITDPFKNIVVDEKVFAPEFISYVAPVAAVGVGLAIRKFGDKL